MIKTGLAWLIRLLALRWLVRRFFPAPHLVAIDPRDRDDDDSDSIDDCGDEDLFADSLETASLEDIELLF